MLDTRIIQLDSPYQYHRLVQNESVLKRLAAAIAFYTCIPIPARWCQDFQTVAWFAPMVGSLLGLGLALTDTGLEALGTPPLTRSALIVLSWVGLTGGLHLDGAMDTADGLAVTDPQRRLTVMADSATGAFGAMAAIAILLLKTTALADMSQIRWMILLMTPTLGRWAQQWAIACYTYLKPTGKGAFHKLAIRSPQDTWPGLALLGCLTVVWSSLSLTPTPTLIGVVSIGGAIALFVGGWFNHQLGGHTGDTYGATVEWTEALFLTACTLLIH